MAFDNPQDAQNAIQQFNGYDWQGRALDVREDRYAANAGFGGGRGGFGGGRGAYMGGGPGFGGGFGGGRGGFQGGFGGRGGGFGGGFGGRGGYGGAQGGYGGPPAHQGGGGYQAEAAPAVAAAPNPFTDYATAGTDPSPVIYVRNVSLPHSHL